MRHKKKLTIMSLSALAPILITLLVGVSCSPKKGCPLGLLEYIYDSDRIENIFAIIVPACITIFPLLLILLFCKETAYRSWKKFSLWYFGIFGVLLSPIIIDGLISGFGGGSGGGLMSNPASIDVGEDVLILGLYFFLSLIVMGHD